MSKWNIMPGRDCVHIGTLGSFAGCTGSLGEAQLKPNIALGIFTLIISFKIMLFSCSFCCWADTLFLLVQDNPLKHTEEFWAGMRVDAVSVLPRSFVIMQLKGENFFWGASVQLGCGQVWDDNIQRTFFPLFANRWWQREPPFLPEAFRSEQLYFLLITCTWKTTVFCSFCPSWDILQQKHWGALGKHCVQLQHNSVTWGKDLISTLCRSYVQWKLYKCSIPAHMSFPQNVTTILLCNSELIKSTQNSLYHILHDVTSFILFPF